MSTDIVHATQLARKGRYEEATTELLESGGRDSTDPAVLDLLARIYAQRGEFADADECWALALRLDPELLSAREGRRRIAALQARGLRPRTGRLVLFFGVTAVVVTGAGVVGALVTRQPPPGPDPVIVEQLREAQEGQQDLSEQLNDVNDRLDDTVARPQRVMNDLNAALAGNPAMTVHVESGSLVVSFPTGVFATGVRLSGSGGTALADLAQRLRDFGTTVSVTVVGHTEDSPVSRNSGFTDNMDLGLARATAAAQRMSEASGLPLSMFGLSSAGAANPPFPNTTPEGRKQNRTVTVVLRPE